MHTYLAQYHDGYNMMNGNDWGWGMFMMLFWTLVVVAIVIFIVRGTHHNHVASPKSGDALEIAKQRYAKGDITKEEFEQLRKDLK